MLEIMVLEDTAKLDRQIKALEWQIQHDSNEKDSHIHRAAYEKLVKERERRKANARNEGPKRWGN